MDPYTAEIASALRHFYKVSGFSYSEISRRSGLSRPTVVRVINGEREITVKYLKSLCNVFGVKPSSILELAEK